MKKILLLFAIAILHSPLSTLHSQCADALKQYAQRYPAAESTDLYKLVFQDLYGPGHLLTDSAAAARYIQREVAEMDDSAYPEFYTPGQKTPFPYYEYTLCDSNFVRVNLILVKKGIISLPQLVSAVLRSTEGMVTPDAKFVMSHSTAFKAAYDPHYRIVRRDIFEREILPAFSLYTISQPVR